MLRKGSIFTDRRAITPVLSSLLLTVIAVAAMAIATTATYVVTTSLRDEMSERVIVEDIWFNGANHSVSTYLRNVGKVSVQISAVYINHTAQLFTKPFGLEIGESRWLNISMAPVPSALYYVDVVTSRGTHIVEYYKAP
jgi:hypothetical protein